MSGAKTKIGNVNFHENSVCFYCVGLQYLYFVSYWEMIKLIKKPSTVKQKIQRFYWSLWTLISHLAQSKVSGNVRPSDILKASGSFQVGGRLVSRGH